jgi:hypothetical protein
MPKPSKHKSHSRDPSNAVNAAHIANETPLANKGTSEKKKHHFKCQIM